MSRIKTRESVKDIKVIDKAAVASERMKTALVRSKDQFENLMDDGQVTPSEYAEDKIRYAAEDVADRVGHDVSAETKKAVNKGKEAYRKHREEKRIEKNEERVNRYEERFRREEQARTEKTSSKESHSHESTTRSSEPQGSAQSRSESASKRQAVSQKQNSIRQRKNVHQQNTVRETASTGGEVRKNAVRGTRNQTIKTAERTEHTIKQSARSAGKKTVKTGAKGTVKSSEKAIKTAEKTSKAAIKTAEKTAKATQKAAQATAKAAQKAAEMARQAAIAAYKAAVAAAKAIAAAIKAIAAAIKELIAAIAAGGWVAVVVIIVICLIGLIVASCFGIFFSSEDTGSTQTMQQVVQEINLDYQNTNPNSLVKKGDFIMADTSEDREGCGNCAYVDSEGQLFAGYHTIILNSIEGSNNKYLAYLFRTDAWRSQIRKRVSGVKLFSISRRILGDVSVVLPPEEEVHRMLAFLDDKCSKVDKLVTGEKKASLAVKALYQDR